MSQVIGPIGSYENSRVIEAIVGATAIRPGDIVKFDTAVLIPATDNDENGVFFVALGYGAIGAKIAVVPLFDCKLKMAATGTPVIGVSYGISDARTLDASNTTQLLLTVTKVGTGAGLDSGFVEAIAYQITS